MATPNAALDQWAITAKDLQVETDISMASNKKTKLYAALYYIVCSERFLFRAKRFFSAVAIMAFRLVIQ